MKKDIVFVLCFSTVMLFGGCDDNTGNSLLDNLTGLTPENDVELGMQVATEIESNPGQYPVLDPTDYPEAYAYINDMKNDILASNAIEFRELFAWELKIIGDDNVLNAFATPGGYIYVYTGLIKFLDKADDLAGVLGHEIAHADRRHSKNQLQKNFGLQLLLDIVLGENTNQITEIAAQLASTGASLKFSRDDESEADEYSVIYLADTDYACNGAFSFFQKLIDDGSTPGVPEFLSTHPDPDNRVEDINLKAVDIGCSLTSIEEPGFTYQDFIDSLP
ncbi:MAG TPA: M48 family metalloprotease [Cyclobacteriaceae bacterium]